MMSVEKCIALYLPFKSRNICTVKTAKWASGIACVFFILADGFWFFVVKAIQGDGGARFRTCVFADFFLDYILVYTKIDAVIYSFAPFAVMGLTNIAIIYKFVQAKLASKRGGTESTNQALSNAAMRGTAILVTVTMTFLILTAPANIITTVSRTSNLHPLLTPFLYISVALNHSINGLLYTIVGTKFRKELILTLRCVGRQNWADVGGKSSQMTNMTNISKISETTSPEK